MQQYFSKFSRSSRWLILFLVLILVSCGGEGGDESELTPEPAPTVEKIQPISSGGNLIMTLGNQDPPTLDPALVGDTTSAFIVRQLFSGLVRLDNEMKVQPDLAEKWEISADKTTYTFTLRKDARFADGKSITSEDVYYSLERATDPKLANSLPAKTYLNDIVGVKDKLDGKATEISGLKVLDPQTIALTIDKPKMYFLSKLCHTTSFVVDRQVVEKSGKDWTEQPNGSGPFEIERWEHNQTLVIKRNANFYRAKAKLDRVKFLIGAAASNAMVLYEEGKIDAVEVYASALARVRDPNNSLSKELVSIPQLSLTYIGMNVTIPPFDDLKVRQAFALLLDRERIAEVSLHGSVKPAKGILPPGIPGYNSELPALKSDLAQAKKLLAESKYGGAANLPPIAAYGSWATTMQEIAEKELGIKIEVRSYEKFSDYLQALDKNQLAMFDISWIADYPDPENFMDVLLRSKSGENHTAYANPEIDALFDKAATETDDQKRWSFYREAEKRILTDSPIIPIYHNTQSMLIKPYVKGLVVTPMDILDLSTVELVHP